MRFGSRLFVASLVGLGLLACDQTQPADAPLASPAESAAAALALEPGDDGMVTIPGGRWRRASGETLAVESLSIDRTEVTTADFAAFVRATSYETDAERWGWSLVFAPSEPGPHDERVVAAPWWLKAEGANWRTPRGATGSEAPSNHPVVQVSWNDARAFCEHRGGRLPSEAEWEWAALGGEVDVRFPWGDDPPTEHDATHVPANLWQGDFPAEDKGFDGFQSSLAPVASFAPNGYGLYDMAGNAWEWTEDVYDPRGVSQQPRAPRVGSPDAAEAPRVMRGGSFLCSASFCEGYRIDKRNQATPDSGLDHTGFRCARDLN